MEVIKLSNTLSLRNALSAAVASLFGEKSAIDAKILEQGKHAVCLAVGQSSLQDIKIIAGKKPDSIFSSVANKTIPTGVTTASVKDRSKGWSKLSSQLTDNELLNSAEELFSDIAIGISNSGNSDIPAYQVIRLAAALLTCINVTGKADNDSPCFVLYSLDLSGIQKFIYSVNTKGALKGLKARSLYLTLLMENTVDDILSTCGLSRANLLYSGGGRAHIILPNDREILAAADGITAGVNRFLMENHDTALYLASGHAEFSGNSLISANFSKSASSGLSDAFFKAASEISTKKLSRYSYDDIVRLNSTVTDDQRECAICGAGRRLHDRGDASFICETCASLEAFATALKQDTAGFAVTGDKCPGSIRLPSNGGDRFVSPCSKSDNALRYYSVEKSYGFVQLGISKLGLTSASESPLTFDDYSEASHGISRLGVFRCDVDGLGALFFAGFKRADGNPWRDYNLARYATLSAALTLFFQNDIDKVLGPAKSIFDDRPCDKISVVYSGGDDVFLIGAWDQALSAGVALQKAFKAYTGGTVTLSGGLGLFKCGLPVTIMAEATEELVNTAKARPGKNSVSLFGITYDAGRRYEYTSGWDEFHTNIIGDKYNRIAGIFSDYDTEKGSAFIYRLVELFRDISLDRNKSGMPRLAYCLSRSNVNSNNAEEQSEDWKRFTRDCYKWAMNDAENAAFRTAALLYTYINRAGAN